MFESFLKIVAYIRILKSLDSIETKNFTGKFQNP